MGEEKTRQIGSYYVYRGCYAVMPDAPSHQNIAPLRNLGPRSEESLFDKDYRKELPPL